MALLTSPPTSQHHRDPFFFRDGFRFVCAPRNRTGDLARSFLVPCRPWFAGRNGDVTDPGSGEKCITLDGATIGHPSRANVSTLVYAYTW